jgi:methylmalonyl-CoA mutase, N-terminal domain
MATRPKDEAPDTSAATKGAAASTEGEQGNGAPSEKQQAALEEDLHRYIAPVVGPDDERRITDSGIEIQRLYTEEDVKPGLEERLGEPGSYPFTRGIHPGMYRDRLWTMRQYAGFASPEDTNERYRYLTEHGSTGLSMAFDLPTQLGRDSDDPLCAGEVGRTGVPIDTLEDMRICFDQIDLGEVSTSMTINAPAAILLLLYELVGEEQGVPADQLRGTVQNDVLKEYVSRGNYIYPPEPTMRLTTDIFAYCNEQVPKWNTISISGYHMREKGCSAVQEVAFTLANAVAYVEAGIHAGLDVNQFGKRLAFFFNGHNNVFQEIAKFRAVRRMWAKIMRERFGATDEKAQMIRFHTQTGGVTLQAQQPEVNIIRVALQGFAAVAGGTQSLHTNGFDEALALPTERSARIALRTQQVLAHESGVADTVDPFAGSYFIESLTDEIEQRSWELMKKVEDLGGSVNALEFIQKEIEESAISYQERYRTEQDIVVGVNKFVTDQVDDVDILKVDPEAEKRQLERLAKWKANRDQEAVDAKLEELREVARGDGNLLYPIKEALRAGGSIGEVCNAMRDVFGEYRGGAFF